GSSRPGARGRGGCVVAAGLRPVDPHRRGGGASRSAPFPVFAFGEYRGGSGALVPRCSFFVFFSLLAPARPRVLLFVPPALSERRHRSLARRLIAVRRRAVLVVAEEQCPHPWLTYRRGRCFHDAADHLAVGKHIVVVIVPFAGCARGRRTLKDQVVL